MTAHVSPRPGLLASVATLAEMRIALAAGVDILDLKNPAEGALGAWAPDMLAQAVALWREAGKPCGLSATIGDLPPDPFAMAAAAERTAALGVPLVKIGFALSGDCGLAPVLAALAPVAARVKLVGVLFADLAPALDMAPRFAAAGFHGLMLDTADKAAGGLLAHLDAAALGRFVTTGRAAGLLTGLAGSLALQDIAPLAALRPHYLGFRGALCAHGRTGALDPARLRRVQDVLAGRIAA